MSGEKSESGPDAIDLLEEAAHLLRTLPAAAVAAYLVGSVPFVVACLFFVADMSRDAFAATRLPGSAIGLTLLFAWMKTWQSIAAEYALARLEHRAPQHVGVAGFLQLAVRQMWIQGVGLVALIIASFLLFPLGWVYAACQSATALGVSSRSTMTLGSLSRQARLWPGQNHAALLSFLVLWQVVFLNVGLALYFIPGLVRMLTGAEKVFTTTGWNPLNSTFLAVAVGLSILALDPLVKSFYVTRCFYGKSRRTGVDLLVRVREVVARGALVALVVICLATSFAAPLRADGTEAPVVEKVAVTPAVAPEDLDASIERVMARPEFAWREPRKVEPTGMMADFLKWARDSWRRIEDWLSSWHPQDGGHRGGGSIFGVLSGPLMLLLMVALSVALVWLVIQSIAGKRRKPVSAVVARVAPVLEDEDVSPDALPENEWMRLAHELLARGEVRLALRAFFLGSLAGLAAHGLLAINRHKSNRDYERELARRGAAAARLPALFAENRRVFEAAWYGRYPVADDEVNRFRDNARMLAGGGGA